MNLKKWLQFNISYLKRPAWDTRLSPPELTAFIASHKPGCAVDLGCGSGTNVVALAGAGWTVLGIDFSLVAVQSARRKTRSFGNRVSIRYGNVTDLNLMAGIYQLVLDIGCFHSLMDQEKARYIENLDQILDPEGFVLMYAHCCVPGEPFSKGLTEIDINQLNRSLTLLNRKDSFDPGGTPACWLEFIRKNR